MLVSDLLHSCANERVAAAAISSIGGVFAARVELDADEAGVTVGAYVSRLVQTFAKDATERDWRDLVIAIRGQDHPVLAGLQAIVNRRPAQRDVLTFALPYGSAVSVAAATAA